ncbi:MAG TPA: acyl-CoA dehydrogenase family protein [Phycisphaerae bacterium]|nr:acyl-CoA dehydrogenase family protein [Phycisphaerae bacterium]
MANFYNDNDDIKFLFKHFDVARLAELMEEGFRFNAEFPHAPENAADAIDNYQRMLANIGEICGDHIAPTAEETDNVGNVLNEDGSVTYAPGIEKALKLFAQADAMGFTLPYRFGGINCPQFVFTMSNDIVSRSDAALMNIYGLQGNADTLNAFASEEIKAHYLPKMAAGEWTGAMVLTEPDAGSDLQAVKVRGYQDESGQWYIHGVKRFITNGCGKVLLVLCRTEPEISDGRGLSLLVCENGPQVKIRRLEHKLGINGSPTCEIFFDNVPAQLVGERQRGLIEYVMSLMNGARIGIASQSVGIGEAAYRVARDYGNSRRQYDVTIDNFPAVRELLVNSQVDLQAARSLTYYATFNVDLEVDAAKKDAFGNLDADAKKANKKFLRHIGRYCKVLTPMAKYYSSEMSMRVANNAIAVLGGSGYMKDYASERHLRDSRITTIYEGTSQLQVIAAVAGVLSGTCKSVVEELTSKPSRAEKWSDQVKPYVDEIVAALDGLDEAINFIKEQSTQYRDLMARKLVDMGIFLVCGTLFADQANSSVDEKMAARKFSVLKHWMAWRMPEFRANKETILAGKQYVNTEFEALAGPVPVLA